MAASEDTGPLFVSTDGLESTFSHPPGFASRFPTNMHSSDIPISQLRHSFQDDVK